MVVASCRESRERSNAAPSGATTVPLADASTITLTGQVTRSFGPYVVQVGGPRSQPVLVVLPTASSFSEGTRLEVSGRISTFSRSDLEAELGVDLGPEVEALTGARCLIASSVRLL